MTRQEQVANDKRYADWQKVWHEEVYDRATHWGDSHKANKRNGGENPNEGESE